MQRANKDALEKLDPNQVYHTFPDRREGSKSSLILKKPKTKKSNRVLYMTKPLKEELLAWLEKLKQDEQNAPEKYSNCGQLFRLPDGLPIAPELLTKWYRQWRSAHPEFEQIVFHRPHTGQTPAGTGRKDRSELLFPRPDPSSTPAPAK